MTKIKILDTTLRDGLQSKDITFSVSDKIKITKLLDEFGVSYIEAGNPISNPKDLEFFELAQNLTLKNAKLCAFSSTRRKNTLVQDDKSLQTLLSVNTPVVCIFGKTWDFHVTEILNATLEENLLMIKDTISYIKGFDKEVIFDAEHFFDGYKNNSEYALKVIQTAIDAGANSICLCDTNGGMLPLQLSDIVKTVSKKFPNIEIGLHAHNDSGCAVANSIMAIECGATQIQGTFLGFGERCGNADLSTIIPNIILKQKLSCDGNLLNLVQTANMIAEIANIKVESFKPYVGGAAFAHKAGMHVDGVLKNATTFEHVPPQSVGNKREFLISEVSGKNTVLQRIKKFAPDINKASPELIKITDELKTLEHYGYQFEAADASFELLIQKSLGKFTPHFNLVFYKAFEDYPTVEGELSANAMIKVDVNGQSEITAASGSGPVNALDIALRKALAVFYPSIKQMHLTDYKVRVIDQNSDTAAKVRVLIESSDNKSVWSTVGVSDDIIEASLKALVDAIEYKLSK